MCYCISGNLEIPGSRWCARRNDNASYQRVTTTVVPTETRW